MTFDEKRLYHQIHPVKLFTDFSTAFISVYLLWKQMLLYAVVIALVPSIGVTIVLVNVVNLGKYGDSAFGRYMKTYMDSRIIDTIRFGGFLLMAIGGWCQNLLLIGLGFMTIMVCWSHGLFFDRRQNTG